MDKIFDWCVSLMQIVAPKLSLTYKELNVWLFVIIHPIITLLLFGLLVVYVIKYKRIKRKVNLLN